MYILRQNRNQSFERYMIWTYNEEVFFRLHAVFLDRLRMNLELGSAMRTQFVLNTLFSKYLINHKDYATSRKVAGSTPDKVIGILHCLKPSGRTVTLRSTQTLTGMSTRSISWG
jgi:hypothetical protein